MTSRPKTLLLTRPDAQSRAFLDDCEAQLGRSIPTVVSPLLRIVPVGDIPDLDTYDTIVLTSGNGVRRLGDKLAGRSVVTVGENTATLAESLGASAKAHGENVEAFLAATPNLGRALFCRGTHSRGNLASRLNEAGQSVDEAVLYDQVAQTLSDAAQSLLTDGAPIVAPVFSPRSAALLAAYDVLSPVQLLAISQSAAEAWTGSAEVRIAAHPTAAAMRQLVIEAF